MPLRRMERTARTQKLSPCRYGLRRVQDHDWVASLNCLPKLGLHFKNASGERHKDPRLFLRSRRKLPHKA